MAQLDLIPLEAIQAWNEALDGIPHGFHHTRDFSYAMHLTTGYPVFLLSVHDGDARMVCPLLEREFAGYLDVATPSGLSGFAGTGTWSRFAKHWRDFVRDRGYVCGYVGLHPLYSLSDLPDPSPRHNSVYVLDLSLERDELLRRMDRNRRRELRNWEDRARDFVLDRDALVKFVKATYEPFMREVGAPPPHLTAEALEILCRSESSLVVGSRGPQGIDAIYVFGTTPYSGDCLINVATSDGRRRATDLLWLGVCALTERRVPVLNLGGGAREDDSVARAKQRLGPRRLPLRSLRQIYRASEYAEMCAVAGVDPRAESDYFPAYRAPDPETAETI